MRKAKAGSTHALRVGYLVLIDQEPLREEAAADCTRAMARLERARVGWHRFERKDKPAFIRWRAREFGALLSRAREVEDRRFAIAQALDARSRNGNAPGFSGCAYGLSAGDVSAGQSSADRPKEGDEPRAKETRVPRKLSDFEKEALFQEWVQRSLGTNPDKMDDEAYSTTFEAFKSHMFRSPLRGRAAAE